MFDFNSSMQNYSNKEELKTQHFSI